MRFAERMGREDSSIIQLNSISEKLRTTSCGSYCPTWCWRATKPTSSPGWAKRPLSWSPTAPSARPCGPACSILFHTPDGRFSDSRPDRIYGSFPCLPALTNPYIHGFRSVSLPPGARRRRRRSPHISLRLHSLFSPGGR